MTVSLVLLAVFYALASAGGDLSSEPAGYLASVLERLIIFVLGVGIGMTMQNLVLIVDDHIIARNGVRLMLSTADASWTLPAGTAHAIPPARHDVHARVDSVCVLTVSLPVQDR